MKRKNFRTKKIFSVFILFGFILITTTSQLSAQQQPPAGATAGVERESLEEIPPEKKIPTRIEPTIKKIIPEKPTLPDSAFRDFYISKVQIEGCTVFSAQIIKETLSAYNPLNYYQIKIRKPASVKAKQEPKSKKEKTPLKLRPHLKKIKQIGDDKFTLYYDRGLSLKDLIDIADKITDLYNKEGYVTSQAYIPPQKIQEGKANIIIVEGKFGKTEANQTKYFNKRVVEQPLKAKEGQILRYSDLTKELMNLNKNPDRNVKAVLTPSEAPEQTDIKLSIEEKRPFHLGFEYNNLGTKYTGYRRNSVFIRHNNFTKHEDMLSVKYSASDHRNFEGYSLSYSLPFNNYASSIGLDGSYARVRLTREYEDLITTGNSFSVSLYLNHKIIETKSVDLSGKFAFDAKKATTDTLDNDLLSDALRIAKAGFTINEYDGQGTTSFRNEFSYGIEDFMGASKRTNPDSSRSGAGGQFSKYNGGLTRYNRLPFSSSVIIDIEGQLTSHDLATLEQLSLGGAYSVRGYPENELLGDYGFRSTVEFRMPFFILPQFLLPSKINRNESFQFIFFADAGHASFKHTGVGEYNDRTLASAGVGLRVNLLGSFSGRLDLAWPYGTKTSDESQKRIHYGVSYEF